LIETFTLSVPISNMTEVLLFGIRGSMRTLQPGRSQVNIMRTMKREHSRKPDEQYPIIEACSPGPYLEMFARGPRDGWVVWGNQSEEYQPTWKTYSNHSQANSRQNILLEPDSEDPATKPLQSQIA